MVEKRSYSATDKEDAVHAVMVQYGGNRLAASKGLGIPVQTLDGWVKAAFGAKSQADAHYRAQAPTILERLEKLDCVLDTAISYPPNQRLAPDLPPLREMYPHFMLEAFVVVRLLLEEHRGLLESASVPVAAAPE